MADDIELHHRRYPFLPESKKAVEESEVSVADVLTEEPVVNRAVERLEQAVEEGVVEPYHHGYGQPGDGDKIDLFSYPIARIILSAVGQRGLIDRFAAAEARRSIKGATDARNSDRIGFEGLLNEFDFDFDRVGDGYDISLGTYAQHAPSSDRRWSLVERRIRDGAVRVSQDQLETLLEWAITDSIRDGLPFDVPEGVEEQLSDEIAEIRDLAGDPELPQPNTVDPDAFPPYINRLYESIRSGESLNRDELFVLATFVSYIGGDRDALLAAEGIRDGGPKADVIKAAFDANFIPPRYETVIEKGLCEPDEAADQHPIKEYADRVA